MISRPLMLTLLVLCSAPAFATQGSEGPYLFDLLKKPAYLAAGHARGRERARLGQPLCQDLRWAGHAVKERGGGSETYTLAWVCKAHDCGDNQLKVCFTPKSGRETSPLKESAKCQ